MLLFVTLLSGILIVEIFSFVVLKLAELFMVSLPLSMTEGEDGSVSFLFLFTIQAAVP